MTVGQYHTSQTTPLKSMHSLQVIQVQKTFLKNEKYVGMKAEKVWRQDYHTL